MSSVFQSRRVNSFFDSLKAAPSPERPVGIPFPGLYDSFLNPLTPILFGLIYFVTAKFLSSNTKGKNYLHGKRWNAVIVVHNLILAIYSGWTFYNTAPALFGGFSRAWSTDGFAGLVHVFCDSDMSLWKATEFPYYCYIFYLSKFYEVLDTVIILAKGKKVGMLQSYHHTGAVWTMYAGYRTMSMPIWIFVVANSMVHLMMYTFYAITSMKLPFPNFLKRQLTKIQITQFLIGGSLAASYLFIQLPTFKTRPVLSLNDVAQFGNLSNTSIARGGSQCVVDVAQRAAVVLNVIYLIPLTYLFASFFVQSYRKKGLKTKSDLKAAKSK